MTFEQERCPLISNGPKLPWVSRDVESWITEYVELQVDFLVTMHPSIFEKNDKILV